MGTGHRFPASREQVGRRGVGRGWLSRDCSSPTSFSYPSQQVAGSDRQGVTPGLLYLLGPPRDWVTLWTSFTLRASPASHWQRGTIRKLAWSGLLQASRKVLGAGDREGPGEGNALKSQLHVSGKPCSCRGSLCSSQGGAPRAGKQGEMPQPGTE